jgi:drug/metabolite transporter (DMT)-like permease
VTLLAAIVTDKTAYTGYGGILPAREAASMSTERDGTQYLQGALYGLAAVSIWSGWIVVARLGLRTSLTPWDIAALRFGVAGLLLLPYVIRKGLAVDRLGLVGLVAIVLGGAAPVFLANAGLLFAPAAHAGALFPGVMPLMVALLAALLLREEFTTAKKIGFALILPGVLAIAWGSGGEFGSLQTIGHGLFLAAGLAWAFYTVACERLAWTDCMPQPSLRSGPCSSTCRSLPSCRERHWPEPLGATWHCRPSCRAC